MPNYRPDRDRFASLAKDANTVPVYCQLLSDQLTPVSAYSRLASPDAHAFLLESVVGGEKIARYSFVGANPVSTYTATGRNVAIESSDNSESFECEDPIERMQEWLNAHRAAHLPELPRFVGGAVGYAGYDVVRYSERLPNMPPDDRGLPDISFGLYDTLVIFDHVQKLIKIVAHAHIDRDGDSAYDEAVKRIERTIEALKQPQPDDVVHYDTADSKPPAYRSNFEKADFERSVEQCKEYIRAGDIFQVVLSQRLTVETNTKPFHLYRALRAINPSPFMFFVQSPQVTLVGASPEVLCRVEDGIVTSRPLAGTRRRGRNEEEDKGLEKELLADPKERAEHIMLVDLARNDVGQVCKAGSVKVTELMTVEYYSHVMHLSSNVSGELARNKTAFDALRAALPVGTVSGAPKVRAMEIIDELEPTKRGPYAGAIGYIDFAGNDFAGNNFAGNDFAGNNFAGNNFAGNMDTCIALRTLVITPTDKGHRIDLQAGAGIVADSEPTLEYQETLNKAAVMLQAITLAETWNEME
jgi:anthranilate synthase component 1